MKRRSTCVVNQAWLSTNRHNIFRAVEMESKSKDKSATFSKKQLITIEKTNVLDKINEYRLSNHLCDVILVSGGREFPAHRPVLAAGGGFFSGLFASNMKEQGEKKIELPQVDQEVMEDILGYIYTGKIQVTQENAQLIIMAADFLLLEKLKQPVDKFLAQVFEHSCLLYPTYDSNSVLEFAINYSCKSLEKTIVRHIGNNFEAIVNEYHEVFLELSAKTLVDVISLDGVIVSSEETVFLAIMKWVRHKKEREKVLDQLLPHIRLCSLTEDFIHSVVLEDPLVRCSPDCVSLVQIGMNTSYDPSTPNVPHPRDCLDTYVNVIFVNQVDLSFSKKCCLPDGIWCYIPSDNSWFCLPTLEKYENGKPFYYQGMIFTLFDAAAVNDNGVFVDRYEVNTNSWTCLINHWSCPTFDFSSACLNGVIYIIGGSKMSDFNATDYVFACDVMAAEPFFKQVASLNIERTRAFVVSHGNYMYAIGGSTDSPETSYETNTMEKYDPESNSWSFLSPVGFSTFYDSPDQCTIANDKIFVIPDGRSKGEKDCFIYDISTDAWSQIPPAPLSAKLGLLTHCQNKLYLISGGYCDNKSNFNSGNIIKTVCYDLKDNSWTNVVSTITLKLSMYDDGEEPTVYYIGLAGTVVRLRKDFVSTLQLLEDVEPATE